MQLHAPAKVNLSFRIRGRRADGFHEIETLMARVSLQDTLTITRRDDAEKVNFVCDDKSLPTGEDNLVVRAARLFFQATNAQECVRIELQKRIPHGAGLGGGSSDAATTLLGLNRMFESPLSKERLRELAAEIGSDVPFFIFESAAKCSGRGELVEPVKLESPLRLLLLKPTFGVPTPWAFGRWKDSRQLPGISYLEQEFLGLKLVNDLERPVFEKHVFLARMKMWLLAQSEVGAAIMSGSGSTLFAALHESVDSEQLADRAKAELDPDLWTCLCEVG